MRILSLLIIGCILTSALQAQITHEKTYREHLQLVTYPGEAAPKYFSLDEGNHEANFYNLDHTPFKTISIPVTNGVLQTFNYLSTQTFDQDDGKEYLVTYRDTANHQSFLNVYDDDQSVMLSTDGNYGFIKNTDTVSLKLMVYKHEVDTTLTKIYKLGGDELRVNYLQPDPAFKIFPNPAVDEFKVSYSQKNPNGTVIFALFNSWGDQILQRRLNSRDSQATFNVSHLSAGSYFARLAYPDGRVKSKRLLILD